MCEIHRHTSHILNICTGQSQCNTSYMLSNENTSDTLSAENTDIRILQTKHEASFDPNVSIQKTIINKDHQLSLLNSMMQFYESFELKLHRVSDKQL